ncbi:olfactory receptor 6F1-like [Pleurodeles waltl]|uniref:olfactory receptor 6F1-like n=1 Tax=Pleurodeles waltl TaxID=8319 RepID=UPI003709C01C
MLQSKKDEDMKNGNTTGVAQFILVGFSGSRQWQVCILVVIFIVYMITILTNILIIAVIKNAPSLHKPMYLFIGTFSFLEICYPTTTVPKCLSNLLTKNKSISFPGCIAQNYFHFSMGATENFLLVTMAFDRYVAICNPLHYSTIMNHTRCAQLALGCWVGGFLFPVVILIQISKLHFCGPNIINHYYCDVAPLVALSCSGSYTVEMTFFILASIVILGSLPVVIISYACIMLTIIQMSSTKGKMKAFSTCASHLTVITIFYGTTIFMFVKPTGRSSLNINKVVSVFPSMVTPLLNPIIYTLRNKEIVDTLRRGTHNLFR